MLCIYFRKLLRDVCIHICDLWKHELYQRRMNSLSCRQHQNEFISFICELSYRFFGNRLLLMLLLIFTVRDHRFRIWQIFFLWFGDIIPNLKGRHFLSTPIEAIVYIYFKANWRGTPNKLDHWRLRLVEVDLSRWCLDT